MRIQVDGVGSMLFVAALWMLAVGPADAQIKKAPVIPGAAITKCPALPSLPSTYAAAVAVLAPPGQHSRFVTRKVDVAGQQPRGTILRVSPVTQSGLQCLVVFDVSDGSLTKVPRLSGLLPHEATNRLKQSNLQAKVSTQNSNSPAGRVFDQRPAADNIAKVGSTVEVFVAAATLVDVPDVIGRQLDEARKLLGRFSVQTGTRASVRPTGEVIAQDPPTPAQRPLRSNVTVFVSDGSLTVVPQLIGKTVDQAAALLKEAALQANLVQRPSGQPIGQVFNQLEPAGREVRRETTVTAYVAIPLPLGVPNVIGMQQSEATTRLNRFTVEQEERQSTRSRGEVIDQDPRAPAQRPPEATVRIFVSDGSRVVVPDVTRIQLQAARKKFSESDLQTGDVEQIENGAVPGAVLTQDPPANTEVQRGSSMTLKVSTGLPVPLVEGDMVKEAREKLTAFKVSTTSIHGAEPVGRVVTQSIKPPTRAAAETRIDLEISDGSLAVVPDVSNMSLADARKVLSDAGFLAERGPGPDFSFATVVSQQPAAGDPATRRSAIRLTVTWPQWFWWGTVVAGLLIIAGVWAFIRRVWQPKADTSKPPLPTVHTTVRVDPASVVSTISDPKVSGPELRVTTRVEAGTSKIDLLDGDSR